MDQERFDDITKALAAGSDRRSVLKRIAGGVFGSVAALSIVGAEAKKKKKNKNKCAKEGTSCTTKTCCSGLECDATSSTCVVPDPPPVTCSGKCNPKRKDSCGDPNTCECITVVDTVFPKVTYHFECAEVKTCRPTYHSCTVGAPVESRFDCCDPNDYCKRIRGNAGFCKPKPTCPVNTQNCRYDWQPCSKDEDDKGCFCHPIKNGGGGIEWICKFEPDAPKGGHVS